MNISTTMYSLNRTVVEKNWDSEDFLQYVKSIGLDHTELLDFYWPTSNRTGAIEAAKRKADELGLNICAYGITNDFAKSNHHEWQQELDKVKSRIDEAVLLNAPVVRIFAGDAKEDLPFDKAITAICDGLRESAAYAQEKGVQLALENHGLLAGSSEKVRKILKETNHDNLYLTFDTGNFILVNEDSLRAFEELSSHIRHVHIKDFKVKPTDFDGNGFKAVDGTEYIGVAPGDGEIPFAEIIHRLHQMNYQGALSIEYEGFDDAAEMNQEIVRRVEQVLQAEEVR